MQSRIHIFEKGSGALKSLFEIENYLKGSTLGAELAELVVCRLSQINQCLYCLEMHYNKSRAKAETKQRLNGLSSWREASYYSERERAAFAWAEAVTAAQVPDQLYDQVKEQFSDIELIDLTVFVTTINTWNRIK